MKVNYYGYKSFAKLKHKLESDEAMIHNLNYSADLFKDKYSFVSFCNYPKGNKLFIGTTNIFGDILIEFDLKTKSFRSCGYAMGYWDPLESKIHKGLWLDENEDSIYFGTATLGGIPLTTNSKGGKLSRYKILEDKFEQIDSPIRGDFFQGTMYDPARKMMYFLTGQGNGFGAYDIRNKKLLRYDMMGSIPHIGVIDDTGGVWSTYGVERHAFCKYIPEKNDYLFPEKCFVPDGTEASNKMYMGAGPIDSAIKGINGLLYFGTALGALLELNPTTFEVKYLGKPFPGIRLPGLALDKDGNVLMCGGSDGAPYIARFDIANRTINSLGQVKSDDGNACYRCHEIVVIDNNAYVAETDNPERSAFLWEVAL